MLAVLSVLGHVTAGARAPRVSALASGNVRFSMPVRVHSNIAMAMMQRKRGPPPPEHTINELIKANELRVVGEPEEPDMPDVPLGIMSRGDALARARELGVDLVCTSPGADPPVCKLIDYGRFKFQLEKKKKMMKKAAHTSEVKELKLSYTIETHDFNVRIRAAQKFLTAGDKVKAVVQFKGREMQHTDIGTQLLKRMADDLAEFGSTDGPPKLSGNRMEVYITPKPMRK